MIDFIAGMATGAVLGVGGIGALAIYKISRHPMGKAFIKSAQRAKAARQNAG